MTNLTVTSNIVPVSATGNTYISGNIIVSGNIYSQIGSPLGEGGGYIITINGGPVTTQTPYTGAVYGTTFPLSIGLSNGFSITGTSTLITVTPNGNFSFAKPGAYLLKSAFYGSDNITGIALGSNVADIHGTDQNYIYRHMTQISQNPTELIEIPFVVTDTTKYYYLDIFMNAPGKLYETSNTTGGGTYLTITPLQGGGLASGGPGGTPGTQWISSSANIYFPNSVGIGTTPNYNLDVGTGTMSARYAVFDNFAGYRNRLINGTFRVAQRANTLSISNTYSNAFCNTWVLDRWHVDAVELSTSNTLSVTIKQDTPIGQING